MSVTITDARRISKHAWILEYTSTLTSPTFHIYVDGFLQGKTQDTRYLLQLEDGGHAIVDILDDANESPPRRYPARWLINWQGTDDTTDHYRIEEELPGPMWTLRRKVHHVQGRTSYQFLTRFLEDVTTHSFRIIPVGINGNQGTALTLSHFMVREPDIPQVSTAYTPGTRTLTISLV